MKELYDLKELLCAELEEYGKKGDLSAGSLDIIDKLAHATKNLDKIIETMEEDEYSNYGGGSYEGDGYGGMSRRMMPDGRSYARGRGMNAKRDSRGRYSSDGYSRTGELADHVRELMHKMPDEHTRQEMHRLANRIEQM